MLQVPQPLHAYTALGAYSPASTTSLAETPKAKRLPATVLCGLGNKDGAWGAGRLSTLMHMRPLEIRQGPKEPKIEDHMGRTSVCGELIPDTRLRFMDPATLRGASTPARNHRRGHPPSYSLPPGHFLCFLPSPGCVTIRGHRERKMAKHFTSGQNRAREPAALRGRQAGEGGTWLSAQGWLHPAASSLSWLLVLTTL